MRTQTIIIIAILVVVFAAICVIDILRRKLKGGHYNKRNCLIAYLMLAPALVLAVLFVLLPIIFSLGYAFTDFYLLEPNDVKFVGLRQFGEIWKNIAAKGDLYNAIINTAKFVVGVVPLQIGLALGLAVLVNRKKKGVGIFKVCFFAPVVISLTVTSYLWLQILSANSSGLLNSLLANFGIPPQDFLRNTKTAIFWIVLLSAWQGCGYQMLIFLSGLTNIRKDLYEAASLDGANAFQKFLHVTVPGLRSVFLYIVITVFIGACKVMVQPMLMTGEQPHTITLSYYMYIQGYKYRWVGYSSAVALLMTIVIGGITLLQRRLLREKN